MALKSFSRHKSTIINPHSHPIPNTPQKRARYSDSQLEFAKAVINGGDRKPSSTHPRRPVVVFIVRQFNGFGAQMLRLLDAVALANAIGATVCIHREKYWNYGCGPYQGWDCYFNRPFKASHTPQIERLCQSLERCVEVDHLNLIDENWPTAATPLPKCIAISTRASVQRAAAVHDNLSAGDAALSRSLAKQVWQLKDVTKLDIASLLRHTGLSERKENYIGLHVRRGDKSKEVPPIPLLAYADAVALLDKQTNMTVFLATDDGAVVKPLQNLLSPRKVVTLLGTLQRHGHVQSRLNSHYLKSNYPQIVQLLAEIEALRTASYFVATFSSNLARFVHTLRDAPEETSISLDDRWATGVAWRTFGEPYCSYHRANTEYCATMQS